MKEHLFNVRAFKSWENVERTIIHACPSYHDLPDDITARASRTRTPAASFSTTSGSETPKKKRFIVTLDESDESSEETSHITPCENSDDDDE